MGLYPYGHVFFGVDLKDKNPFDPELNSGLSEEEWDKLIDESVDKVWGFNDDNPDAPVEIVLYGASDGEPYYALALKDSHQTNSWDDASPFIYTRFSNQLIEEADEWCEENGLPAFKNPKWLLTASYG